MIPVDQTVLDPVRGDCFSACVASILELPLEQVPWFMGHDEWWPVFTDWCKARGVEATFWHVTGEGTPPSDWRPEGYSIAGGPSPRHPGECHHACVALDGKVVHDPHPARLGLGIIDSYVTLTRIASQEAP